VFGQRLRRAGLLGSMGTVGNALDNAVAESFFASPQRELLDRHTWPTRAGLAQAMFHWIEAFYNPTRRHPPSATSAPSTTNPTPWHDHHTKPVQNPDVTPLPPTPTSA
jgi:putative transposase